MCACEPGEAGLDPKPLEDHRLRNRWQSSLGILAGLAECVLARDKVAYLDLMGNADVERGTPVRPSTLFRCFSMTKPITAVALMRLVEQKRVGLDDAVAKYIPSFATMQVVKATASESWDLTPDDLEPLRRTITLRHLLTHTSGLAYGPDRVDDRTPLKAESPAEGAYVGLVEAVDRNEIKTLAEFCDALATLPLRFQPGSQWLYSHGVDVVGRIIEVVSGVPLDAFLRDQVCQPLGMTRTTFFVGRDRARNLAAMYLAEKEEQKEDEPFGARLVRVDGKVAEDSRWVGRNKRVLAGGGIMGSFGGGLVSCLRDTALFVSMLANNGRSTSTGEQFLQRSTVRALWTDWLALRAVVGHNHCRRRKLQGWEHGPLIGWNPLGHVRRRDKCLFMGGWSTSWAIYPKTGLATIYMSQSLVYFDVPGWITRKDDLDAAVEFGVAQHRRRRAARIRWSQLRACSGAKVRCSRMRRHARTQSQATSDSSRPHDKRSKLERVKHSPKSPDTKCILVRGAEKGSSVRRSTSEKPAKRPRTSEASRK